MIRTCCLTGHPDISKAEGHDEKVAGLTCYMSGNDENKKVIVLLTDVLGNSPHAKTLCDNYAKLGFKVCMIDLFNGAPIPVEVLGRLDPIMKLPPDDEAKVRKTIFTKIWNFFYKAFLVITILPSMIPFVVKHARKAKLEEKIKMILAVTKELSKTYEDIAVVGFCYGGTLVDMLSVRENVPFKAFANVHGRVNPTNFTNSRKPVFVGAASFDLEMSEKKTFRT